MTIESVTSSKVSELAQEMDISLPVCVCDMGMSLPFLQKLWEMVQDHEDRIATLEE